MDEDEKEFIKAKMMSIGDAPPNLYFDTGKKIASIIDSNVDALKDIVELHCRIISDLENRILQLEKQQHESNNQRA